MNRREFLLTSATAAGTIAYANSLAAAVRGGRDTDKATNTLDLMSSSRDVTVEAGPWQTLPDMGREVVLKNLFLRMPDGVRLNAFLYLPSELDSNRAIPALLNTHPYRNMPSDDSVVARHGYASLFVDVRGTGGSEGKPEDEYSVQEHLDTVAIIDWLSKQAWCNGNVGMYGGSYSAINSLQLAYEFDPPALKAIFLRCGTDERYTDDIHYPGGAMLMIDSSWALGMLVMNALPGAPDYVVDSKVSLDRWNSPPWIQNFLNHQTDGPYWRRGSLSPDYSRLTTPTFLLGGYLDIYQNQVMRVMKNATNAVTRGILGPWHHSLQQPGPAIDQEALRLRWFDQWLKDEDTGILSEPRAAFYMPEWRRQTFRDSSDVPGEWRFLDDWPDQALEPDHRLYFDNTEDISVSSGVLSTDAGNQESELTLAYVPGTGARDQSFGPTSVEGYYGLDRREDDAFALTFDSPPLESATEILGFARAKLYVASTAPVTNWIVRLCDVAPDGTSYLISRGYLNGTHRESHTNPKPLIPGDVYELDIQLASTAYRFSPGHRVRISVSNAEFPVLWPSPEPLTSTLYLGGEKASYIELPVVENLNYRKAELPSAEPGSDGSDSLGIEQNNASWYTFTRDYERSESIAKVNLPFVGNIECRVNDDQPGYASMNISSSWTETDDDRRITVRSNGTLSSTPKDFTMDITAELLENDQPIRSKRWQHTVKRQLV